MNLLDGKVLDQQSFAWRDILGQDKWEPWTPSYSFATATSLTVVGRYRVVGRQCFCQVQSSGTSIVTTGGASYIAFPIAGKGYGGVGSMSNVTGKTQVGSGHVDVANSRYYPPSQSASADTFTFSWWYEI